MNQIQLIPFKDCFTVDVTSNITALHETGHVITMYALGMMDHLAYVTTKAGSGTLGLTEMTDEYKATLTQLGNDIIQTADNLHHLILGQGLIGYKVLVDGPGEEVEGGEYGTEVLINQRKQGFSLTIQVELREDDVYQIVIYATHILIRNMVEATDSTTAEESADVGEVQSGCINTTLLDNLR